MTECVLRPSKSLDFVYLVKTGLWFDWEIRKNLSSVISVLVLFTKTYLNGKVRISILVSVK